MGFAMARLTRILFAVGIVVVLALGLNVQKGHAQFIPSEKLGIDQQSSTIKIAAVKLDNNLKGGISLENESEKPINRYSISVSKQSEALAEAIEWSIRNEIKVLDVPADLNLSASQEAEELETAKSAGMILIRKMHSVELNKSMVLDIDRAHLVMINNNQLEQQVVEPVLLEENGVSVEDSILRLLDRNPNLTHDQVYNLLTTSAVPYENMPEGTYMINVQRAIELLEMQGAMDRDSTLNFSSAVSLQAAATSAGVASIVPIHVTPSSITWEVAYPVSNAWGNRLELFHQASGTWTDISGTYYTPNGTYLSSNLLSGHRYFGRLTYQVNSQWVVVDAWISTIATGSAEITVQNLSHLSAELKVKFPANQVYGNRIELYNYSTGAWTFVTDYFTADGNYTVSNLTPGTSYFARMLWQSGSEWQLKDVNFGTPGITGSYQYEYDSKGRLKTVKDAFNNVVATYTYDENGNLKRIQK